MKHVKLFESFGTMFDVDSPEVDRVVATRSFDEDHFDYAMHALEGGRWKNTKPGKVAEQRLASGADASTALVCAVLDSKAMDAFRYEYDFGPSRRCYANAIKAAQDDAGFDVMTGLILDKKDTRGPYAYTLGKLVVHAFLRSGGALYDPTIVDVKSHLYYPLQSFENVSDEHELAVGAWSVANAYEAAANKYAERYKK
jgi:hypothetical protein